MAWMGGRIVIGLGMLMLVPLAAHAGKPADLPVNRRFVCEESAMFQAASAPVDRMDAHSDFERFLRMESEGPGKPFGWIEQASRQALPFVSLMLPEMDR